jgi:hypothetical protein
MSTVLVLADARARGVSLPADDDVAQDILDEVEAWLAARIGPLTGSRTETFYVGVAVTDGRLALRRTTDSVTLTDAGAVVSTNDYRLMPLSADIIRRYAAPSRLWMGPYVEATYTPNDEARIRGALYDLVAVAAAPAGPYVSEQMGAYSYNRGSVTSALASKAAIADALLPKRDQFIVIHAVSRQLVADDPLINRAEPNL